MVKSFMEKINNYLNIHFTKLLITPSTGGAPSSIRTFGRTSLAISTTTISTAILR